jgi:hypothetical protein
MKLKHLLSASLCAVLFLGSITKTQAQDYKSSLGLGIDFGSGATFVGPSYKHFFNARSAFQGEVLFASGSSLIQAFYQYHLPIKEAPELKFYFGGGVGFNIVQGGSAFLLRPVSGLDYKLKQAPLVLNFDWRPVLILVDEVSAFEPARFGLGLKYSF